MRSAAVASRCSVGRVLFIGSYNYFRSRFCEELFNALAAAARISWVAFSRASVHAPATATVGPMSMLTVEALRRRGIRAANHLRVPLELTAFDFQAADVAIGSSSTSARCSKRAGRSRPAPWCTGRSATESTRRMRRSPLSSAASARCSRA